MPEIVASYARLLSRKNLVRESVNRKISTQNILHIHTPTHTLNSMIIHFYIIIFNCQQQIFWKVAILNTFFNILLRCKLSFWGIRRTCVEFYWQRNIYHIPYTLGLEFRSIIALVQHFVETTRQHWEKYPHTRIKTITGQALNVTIYQVA